MAAPDSTVWGSIVNSYGKIGIYVSTSSTNTTTTVSIQVWFWSRYRVSDTSNTFYFDNGASSATTSRGSVSISHTSSTSWSTSNQTQLGTYSYSYSRGTSASTKYCAAKLTSIEAVGSSMSVSTSYTVPKLATYTITYNANGGSGAPSSQTKYYGKSLTLSTTKPTRTGYSFQGWATSSTGSVAYAAGASYTTNAAATLYAVWQANTYTVSYNANGGSGAPSSQTKTYGVTLTLSTTEPTRTNYNFTGWATSSTGSVAYAAGGSYTANAAVTLYAVWEEAYIPPTITALKAYRVDDNLDADPTGDAAIVAWSWTCNQNAGDNYNASASLTCNGRTTDMSADVNTTWTYGNLEGIVDWLDSTDESYEVTVSVTDSMGGKTTKSTTIPAARFPIDFLAGGRGTAIGEPATDEDIFAVGFNTHMHKPVTIECDASEGDTGAQMQLGNKTEGTNTYYEAKSVTGTAIRFGVGSGGVNHGLYSRVASAWIVYVNSSGETVVNSPYGIKNNLDGTSWYPYYTAGDSITVNINTAGYVTNSSALLTFTVPIDRPVIGSSTVTAKSANGFTIRQNGSYAFGSSSSVYATPDSYVAAIRAGWIYVAATFSDTTNVINNAAAGISWSGTLTFS